MGTIRQRFFWPDALPDANPPPLSRPGTDWGVPEGNFSGGVMSRYVVDMKCLKNESSEVLVETDAVKERWREHMERLLTIKKVGMKC